MNQQFAQLQVLFNQRQPWRDLEKHWAGAYGDVGRHRLLHLGHYVNALELLPGAAGVEPCDIRTVAAMDTYLGMVYTQGKALLDNEDLEQYAQLRERVDTWLGVWAPKVAERFFAASVARMNGASVYAESLPEKDGRNVDLARMLDAVSISLDEAIQTMHIAQAFETPATKGERNVQDLRQCVDAWKKEMLAQPWTHISNQTVRRMADSMQERLVTIEQRAGQDAPNNFGRAFLSVVF